MRGAHPIDAHGKWVDAMEKAQDLQIEAFIVSELNTNVKLPLYHRLVKSKIKDEFPSTHVVMATCKDEHDIPRRKCRVLVAEALGHERRIRKSGEDPYGIGSFTYITMDAPEVHKLTVILVCRPCAVNADACRGTIWKQQWAHAQQK